MSSQTMPYKIRQKESVNDWRDNNNSFRSEYIMELEHYLHECHPNSLLKGEPHVNSKLKA